MYKPNNKKMLTVLISVTMVLSALAIIAFAATPAYAASGTFTTDPTTFTAGTSSGVSTIVTVSGGTFGSGSTVYFYLSTTQTSAGILPAAGSSSAPTGNIGSVTLTAGTTTLSGPATFKMYAPTSTTGAVAGTYYILAEDYISGAPSGTYALGPQVTLVAPPAPSVSVTTLQTVGNVAQVTGANFDSSASVTLYLNYPGSSTVLATATTTTSGSFTVNVTIPALSGTVDAAGNAYSPAIAAYNLVAQETNAMSSTYTEGGITASTTFNVEPTITVTPTSSTGAVSSAFTIVGAGFVSGQTIAASTASTPVSSITIGPASTTTYHSAVTVASDGSFSVSVTLSAAVTTYGAATVVVSTGSPTASDSFADAVFISSPNIADLGFSFSITPTAVSTQNSVGDPVASYVWNFPASTTVSVYLGSVLVGTITTDSNGYGALPATAVVPAMVAGTYNAQATTSTGLYSSQISETISSYYTITDPSGTVLSSANAEYFPSDGNYTVSAYGLSPSSTYTFTDSFASADATMTAKVGVLNADGTWTPAINGTLIFVQSPMYAYDTTPPSTGSSPTTFALAGVTGAATFSYDAIGSITVTSPTALSNAGAGSTGLSFTASGMIPTSATTLYPGLTDEYNVYIGTTELAFGATSTSIVKSSSGSPSVSYTNPTLSNGIYNLSVVYNGQSVANAIFTEPIVISASSSSLSSGTLVLAAASSSATDYSIVGYGFDDSTTVALYYMTASGRVKVSTSITPSFGAFVEPSTISIPPSGPAGTYSVFAFATTSSSNYTATTSYTIVANITLSHYSGFAGDHETLGATGLSPDQQYAAYFDNMQVATFTTDSTGTASGVAFTVPTLADGIYTINVEVLTSLPSGNSSMPATGTVVASAGFKIVSSTSIVLSTDAPVAFPGQLVTYSWTPATMPAAVGSSSGAYGPVEVSVLFNGTVISSSPAAVTVTAKPVAYLNGSFLMPNDPVGSYWYVTLSWTQVKYGATSVVDTFTQSSAGSYIQLVSGNGALLTGISSSQIASLTAAVGNQITTSMKIPLSELNASVASIKGLTANITTAFGTMTTTLSTINATVASIESGQVLVQTDLGSIKTSLSSLNASITAFNGNVATISTTLGNVQTSLSSIGTQVTTNGNGIATITTDLGNLSGTVTSMNGNLGTISTNLGTLNANVTKISSPISSLEIFLIVIIVLVLITLVLSFLAIGSVNRVSKKVEEQKKP